MDTHDTNLTQQLQQDADQLRRELEGTIHQCREALNRLDEGSRPSTSITGRILTHDVERYAGRVELMLNFAGSDILPHDEAVKALQRGRR